MAEEDGSLPNDIRDNETNCEELPRPRSYQEAVAVALRLISARLNADPKARWRIHVDRTEPGSLRIYLKTDYQGRTRDEIFAQRAAGNETSSLEDRAMFKRLEREEIARKESCKGRPTREHAALKNSAGQSTDAIIFETCLMLTALGWKPLARAAYPSRKNPLKEEHSVFDAVAEAISNSQTRNVSYSGVRDAYYRLSD